MGLSSALAVCGTSNTASLRSTAQSLPSNTTTSVHPSVGSAGWCTMPVVFRNVRYPLRIVVPVQEHIGRWYVQRWDLPGPTTAMCEQTTISALMAVHSAGRGRAVCCRVRKLKRRKMSLIRQVGFHFDAYLTWVIAHAVSVVLTGSCEAGIASGMGPEILRYLPGTIPYHNVQDRRLLK